MVRNEWSSKDMERIEKYEILVYVHFGEKQ
jgi:hypothetical protein